MRNREEYIQAYVPIDRWVEAGILPEPEYINDIRYWDEDEVEEGERERKRLQSEERRAKRAAPTEQGAAR
jgi:hypothetical protein